ncbi:MAG: cupredoxin domain-containing protein [Chloroflexota bacterium]|nr:cupredoxin domain-containing protein [Chloroflexota bacterium]
MTSDARHERRLREIEQRRQHHERAGQQAVQRQQQLRALGFLGVIVAVLAIGGYLAFGSFFNRPSAAIGTIDVQSSMAGFTPSTITVTAGTVATLNWWTDDAAMHMTGGVHTMISPELGMNEQLPAESRRMITWQVPDKPGTYDVWCDSCCGGKDAPQMHGKIVILPNNA